MVSPLADAVVVQSPLSVGISALLITGMASCESARRRPLVVTGLCPPPLPGPSGLAGRCGRVEAAYRGGINPNFVTDAGLGVKGDAFYSSSVLWLVHRDVDDGWWLGHGCRGGGSGGWSAWLALRRAPCWWWWLFLLVLWTAGGIAVVARARSLSLAMASP